MKIGIFGGTFNPPHKTHIEIVQEAQRQLGLSKLLVIPSGDPPHKIVELDKQHRLNMSMLAFDNLQGVSVCDYEVNLDKTNYSITTLQYLKDLYPNDELIFVIGSDSLRDFDKWFQPREIVKLCTLAVVARVGDDIAKLIAGKEQQYSTKILQVEVNPTDVSSTEIRLMYEFNMDATNYVSNDVNNYIKQNCLYSNYCNLTKRLPDYLSVYRQQHTFYVTLAGLELARKHHLDVTKVAVACILHDIAKEMSPKCYSKYGYVDIGKSNAIVHQYLGKLVAEKDFGITDYEILDAIEFHTTGKPNYSKTGMALYVADKIEKTRTHRTEHLICDTLEETFFKTIVEVYEWAQSGHNEHMDSLTNETIDFLKDKFNYKEI